MKTKIYKIYTHDFEIFLRCAELEYGGLKTSIFNGGVLSREHIHIKSCSHPVEYNIFKIEFISYVSFL